MKSGNLNFLEPSGPLQACNGTALPFYVKGGSISMYCIVQNFCSQILGIKWVWCYLWEQKKGFNFIIDKSAVTVAMQIMPVPNKPHGSQWNI
jgi:hypothetical protein